MDATEPRLRRRGFFLHTDTIGEADTGEHESPEGFKASVRISRSTVARRLARLVPLDGRSRPAFAADEAHSAIRSKSATGSRQQVGSRR